MKFLLGRKLDMTQTFREDGEVVPVTRVQAGPCIVTQIKSEKEKVKAVQLGFEKTEESNLNKPQQGHLDGLQSVKILRDFVCDSTDELKRGDVLTVDIFERGDKVDVQGATKGKGFQGVVKRHSFAGAPATHGTKDQHRMPGSAGATGQSRVFKGKKMPGRMGGEQTTIKNLEVVEIKPEEDEIWIKGGLPGAKGNLLKIVGEGEIDLKQPKENNDDQEDEQDGEKEKDNT